MKVPVYQVREGYNKFSIYEYDSTIDDYCELRDEIYPSLEMAETRAKELNKNTEPTEII